MVCSFSGKSMSFDSPEVWRYTVFVTRWVLFPEGIDCPVNFAIVELFPAPLEPTHMTQQLSDVVVFFNTPSTLAMFESFPTLSFGRNASCSSSPKPLFLGEASKALMLGFLFPSDGCISLRFLLPVKSVPDWKQQPSSVH